MSPRSWFIMILSSDLAGAHPRRRRCYSVAPGRRPHPEGRSAAEDGEAVAGAEWVARPPPQAGVSFGNRGLSLFIFILIQWEFPRLCRGGSRSLTFQGVVSGHPSMKLPFVSRQSTSTMEVDRK